MDAIKFLPQAERCEQLVKRQQLAEQQKNILRPGLTLLQTMAVLVSFKVVNKSAQVMTPLKHGELVKYHCQKTHAQHM